MIILVDTCILLLAFDANSPHYRLIRRSLRQALEQNVSLVSTVQNIAEFWNAGTRPLQKNGYGLSAHQVRRRVEIIERLCEIVAEDSTSYGDWKRIVEKFDVQGVSVHDARLVSVMLRVGVKSILTLNGRDFRRYADEGIEVHTPESFLAENAPRNE
jgi:predicted nucleic acid-binding protein